MTDDTLELTRRKILLSAGAVGLAGAGAGFGTSALFSDEEAFQNNSITAGTLNLTVTARIVEANSYYTSSGAGPNIIGAMGTADGEVVTGLQADDVKPGDWVIICFDITIEGNPAYVQISADDFAQYENGQTEPEIGAEGDDGQAGGSLGDPLDGQGEGELQDELLAEVYDSYDSSASNDPPRSYLSDPDNSLSGTAKESFDQFATGVVLGGSSSPTAIPAGTTVTKYLLLYLPRDVGNVVQSDALVFDLVFETEQARNNDNPFGTSGGGGGSTQITSPASGNTGFGSALDSGSPVVAGEPGFNNDEGRAWILPDSGGSVTQGAKLTASQPGDRVGETVAVDGNTAVVGAPGTNSGAGEVYIYNKSGGNWSSSPDFALTNADNVGAFPVSGVGMTFTPGLSPVPFGSVVDIDGDIIVAGARPASSGLVGYNAFQRSQDPSTSDWVWIDSFVDFQSFTDVATDSGVGLLINQDPTDQVFRVFPTAPNPPFDRFGPGNTGGGIPGFGAEGDISSGTVFIGATDKALVYEQTGTQTIGSVQIPTYNDSPTASLNPSSGATGVGFGTQSLAAEGTAVAVGAPSEGDGVTYVYKKSGGSWSQSNRIIAPSGASDFGRALALSSSTLYVGASTSGGGSVFTYPI